MTVPVPKHESELCRAEFEVKAREAIAQGFEIDLSPAPAEDQAGGYYLSDQTRVMWFLWETAWWRVQAPPLTLDRKYLQLMETTALPRVGEWALLCPAGERAAWAEKLNQAMVRAKDTIVDELRRRGGQWALRETAAVLQNELIPVLYPPSGAPEAPVERGFAPGYSADLLHPAAMAARSHQAHRLLSKASLETIRYFLALNIEPCLYNLPDEFPSGSPLILAVQAGPEEG